MTNDADDEGRSNDETQITKETSSLVFALSHHLAYLADISPFSIHEIRGHPLAAATPH
jgi:hypothetical protein